MKKQWQIRHPDPETIMQMSKTLKCHPITAAVLINRHILNEPEASGFLNVSLKNMRSPFTLKDMDRAVHRIYDAIKANEKILIFGDYDVDGVTATAILLDFFRYIGANVSYYIPHRINEGYGLHTQHITNDVLSDNTSLVITADNGSASFEAVAKARASGVDVIITDHHNIAEKIPPALAVINPKRHDCIADLDHLAGVGVAFCLLICLRKYLRDRRFWDCRSEPNLKNYCDLVALGTIADMVPLVYENRIFSKIGLELIKSCHHPGIQALMEVAGISKNAADADDIAFRLAPRLNAAGRMVHASIAVDLLTTKDVNQARQIANSLNTLNQKRQDLEKRIIDDILAGLKKNPDLLKTNSLVLWNRQWHEGVLGIVASRMVEKYYRPVVLVAVKDQFGKGSARSIPEIDLYQRLLACESTLENFGGHSMAAGLKVKIENLELFKKHFEDAVGELIETQNLMPTLYIDGELDFRDISERLIDELESLAPFGTGNSEPIFMARNVSVVSSQVVGHNHRRMVLKQTFDASNQGVHAIHFNVDTGLHFKDSFERIAFKLRWNRWNAAKTAQLIIEDVSDLTFPVYPG